MVIPIIIGVLTLLVLVAAFLASKHWHWAHVTILVLFYFASLGYVIFAAESLSIRTEFQKKEKQALESLAQQKAGIEALENGSDEGRVISRLIGGGADIDEEANEFDGLRELQFQLMLISRERGRVWRNAMPDTEPNPTTGTLSVAFPIIVAEPIEGEETEEEASPSAPGELGLNDNAVVYLFEQGNHEGGQQKYIGEFQVSNVIDRTATFTPLAHIELDHEALQRLQASPGPWIVYESMPLDRNERFADYSEEELREMLPAETVEEYLRDRTPQEPDDDPLRLEGLNANGEPATEGEEVVSYRYRRMQRDYAKILKDYDKEYSELTALIQASTADLTKLESALEGAKRLQAHREEEIGMLENDLASLQRDRKVIEQHVAALSTQITKAKRLLTETLEENASIAASMSHQQGDLTPVATGALDVDAL